jgi:Ni,Fe-hydrogenase III large subunit
MILDEIDPDFIEGAVKLTDLDEAIIGVAEEFTGNRIVYSKNKVLEILQKDMSEEEAIEYYYYNILGLYASEQNPVFFVD